MAKYVERRKCKRFRIPDAKVRWKKTRLFGFPKNFSKPHTLLNLSKGGISFICNDKFSPNEKIVVQLMVTNENPLNLYSKVSWQEKPSYNNARIVGITFMPFCDRKGWNSQEALNVLRRLEAQYMDKSENDIGITFFRSKKEPIDVDIQAIW